MPKIAVADVRAALATPSTAADRDQARLAYGRWGAHRAYLIINGTIKDGVTDYSRKAINAAIKLLEPAGARIVRAHGCDNEKAIYLGYDNFEGGIYAARGEAIGRALKTLGISCRVDAAGD